MDDSWSFRTERGRAWVADGSLRTRGSVVGFVRSVYHERWKRADGARKVLYLFSFVGTATWLGNVVPALEALVGPSAADGIQWFKVAVTALAVLVVAWRLGRTNRLSLERVETARREGRTLTVEYDDSDGGRSRFDLGALVGSEDHTLKIEALTEEDADRAVEALRLKGVDVEDRGREPDDEGSDSIRDEEVTYDILGRRD
ncbi:hypothetical protein [Halorussus halobius]|uniref:hypothetical protein n=1 Tax=Halorussus halobius TaxID=1710537 RepID=UPI001092546F|nr:hypothetical protein [Halorussus halobius]